MSPRKPGWSGARFPSYAPKKPPPEHGIKLERRQLVSTWWGQRWIEALERVLAGDAGRLSRGRAYARRGRTHDFHVEGGAVTALVTGSRPEPYAVRLTLTQLSESAWPLVIAEMTEKAQFAAELLAGHMPQRIEDAFQAAGASLFPASRSDLQTSCSCPDWGDPCKHVAAVHYVLGDALDRDPFLLFELRGRTREQVLAELRARRGDAPVVSRPAGVKAGTLAPQSYDRRGGPLPALELSFELPAQPGGFLKQLGAPASWQNEEPPAASLAPVIRTAAELARRLALSDEATPPLPAAPPARAELPPPPRPRKRATRPRRSSDDD